MTEPGIAPATVWYCRNPQCGAMHEFSAFMRSNWGEELYHQCECGAVHSILGGIVRLKRLGKRPRQKFV